MTSRCEAWDGQPISKHGRSDCEEREGVRAKEEVAVLLPLVLPCHGPATARELPS